MKKIHLLIILSLIIFSCNDNDSGNQYSYNFYEKSTLTISSEAGYLMKTGKIEEGENLVFQYKYETIGNELITDDEYSEKIMFEINPNLDKFSYSDAELLNIKCVFTRYSQFLEPDSLIHKNVNPTGTITGEKIANNEWKIKINVTFYGDELKVINGRFKLKK